MFLADSGPDLGGNIFLIFIVALSAPRFKGLAISGRLVAEVGPETTSGRPCSSHSAGCTETQPWRPHLPYVTQ